MADLGPPAVECEAIRRFLVMLVPRKARGVRLDAGGRQTFLARGAPIPWADIERSMCEQRDVRVVFAPPEQDEREAFLFAVWIHRLDHNHDPAEIAGEVASLSPAAVVRTVAGADLYWRVHPVTPEGAAPLMAGLADLLYGIAGQPAEPCFLPLAASALWTAQPPTIWAPSSLLAAARRLAPRVMHEPQAAEEAVAEPAIAEAQCVSPRPSDAVAWPEMDALLDAVARQEGVSAEDALWLFTVREVFRRLGASSVAMSLGVASVGVVGGAARVLREGRWWTVGGGPGTWWLRPVSGDASDQ